MYSIPSIATRRGGRSTPGPWKQRNLARHYTSISSHRARTVVVRCIWTSLTYVHTYVALLERPNRGRSRSSAYGPTCQLDYPRLALSAADACPSHSHSHATNTTQHNHRGAGGAKGEDDARVLVLLLVEAARLSWVGWSGVEGLSRSRVLVGFGSAR
jgi:hypothetical protein